MPDSPRPSILQPSVSTTTVCKCCGQTAILYGVADFNKNSGPAAGIPIYYYRCPRCGFIFSTAYDDFTHHDFSQYIYNADYLKLDGDYLEKRPRNSFNSVESMFGKTKNLRILDYGGGNGLLARLLIEAGFTQTVSYDPYVPEFSQRPTGRFDLILSFEVFEHSPQPRQMLADIDSMLHPNGLILFSTLLQPPEIDQIGMNWWYITPRNAHISIFTKPALQFLAQSFNLKTGSITSGVHIFLREIPDFAKHLFKPE